MGGLVAYESSEEEDEVPEVPEVPELPVAEKSQTPSEAVKTENDEGSRTTTNEPAGVTVSKAPAELQQKQQQQPQQPSQSDQPIIGPQMGPQMGPEAGAGESSSYPPLEEDPTLEDDLPASSNPPPGSPYSAERAAVRSLTLPPGPANTDIPPSPPGSPPRALSKKFAQFLELKKKGVHFNAKVASSPALANPALADKLLAFVGADARDLQYATTLPADLWDPAAFPRSAFREQLRAAQVDGAKERARGRGAAVEFVPAAAAPTATGSGSGSGSGSGGSAAAAAAAGSGASTTTGKRKTRFDK